ncbi:MAG: hypothetical protein AABX89_00225 [Candidatus Thermoplasmatota archaeon]
MRWIVCLAAALLLTVLATPAQAALEDSVVVPASDACAGPPCGYISAFVNLQMEDKKPCRKPDLSDCAIVPAPGESATFKGLFQYYWKISEDATYPFNPQTPIQVSFAGVASNHKWLPISIEPKTLEIGIADMLDPANHRVEEQNGNQVLFYWYERDVTITIRNEGTPTADELARVEAKDGRATLLLKVKTTANEPYFKEGFGTEDFRFDASSLVTPDAASSRDAPAGGLLAGLLALAAVATVRRRNLVER